MGSEKEYVLRHIRNAVIYSWDGLKAAWDNEMAFRIEAIVVALMMPVGIWIGETAVQWALLVASSLLVLVIELLNSAVEKVVDRVSAEHHILSKQAKDLGSAAAAVSMLIAVIVWALIAYERLVH